MGVCFSGEALGVDHLDHVSRIYVFYASLHRRHVLFSGEVRIHLSRTTHFTVGTWRKHQGLGKALHQVVNLAGGFFIGAVHISIQADVADHLDIVAKVVEDQQGIDEGEDRVYESAHIDAGD